MYGLQVDATFDSHPVLGGVPGAWVGVDAVDGDRAPWIEAPVGSIYVLKPDETSQPTVFVKRSANDRDDDWGAVGGFGVFHARFTRAQMTDGGSTTGTIVLPGTIPVGAWAFRTVLRNVTGFTGDASATITIGDGSDADRYNTGTPSVFTTVAILDVGAISGTVVHATAVSTVTVTIAAATAFAAVEAGAATVDIYYLY